MALAGPTAARTSTTYKGIQIPHLDLDTMKGRTVKVWQAKWQAYVNVSGLGQQSEQTKIDMLYQCLSTSTLDILLTLVPNPVSLDECITAITKHAEGNVNPIVEQKQLFERVQRPEESVSDFAVAIRTQINRCSFGQSEHDNILRTVFVVGLRDHHTIEAVLALNNPTFKEVTNMAISREYAHKSRQVVQTRGQDSAAEVNRMSANASNTKRGSSTSFSAQTNTPPCPWCGNVAIRHTRTTCPAASLVCRKCNKKGHMAKVCRSSGTQPDKPAARSSAPAANQLTATSSQQQQLMAIQRQLQALMTSSGTGQQSSDEDWLNDPTVAHIFAIDVNAADNEDNIAKAPRLQVRCNYNSVTRLVQALPDTGADISAAGEEFLQQFNIRQDELRPSSTTPRAADGSNMNVKGCIDVSWQLQGSEEVVQDTIHIIEGTTSILLSWSVVQRLGLLSANYPCPQRDSGPTIAAIDDLDPESEEGKVVLAYEKKLVHEFDDVFSTDIKVMKGDPFEIVLEPDAAPRAFSTPRPVPMALRQELVQELRELENRDIIEPVVRPTDWCSPIVVERKPNGSGVRVCVDFTEVNRFVKREWYLSDSPHTLVSTIPHTAVFFTTLDATKGYHQCELAEKSRDVTTFITPVGRFRYKRAPFGISSISEHYNRRMDEALVGMQDYKRTTDDVLLHDDSIEQQYNHVRSILKRCREQGITLSRAKFKFARRKVKFAGYIVQHGSYHLDEDITRALEQFPQPKTRKQLRSFMGLANQLSASTSKLASLLQQLRPLLSTKTDYTWNDVHQNAFEAARKYLASPPTLAYFQLHAKTRVTTDASRTGLGFVLQQYQEDEWKTIQAGSRMLSDAETRYAIIELEMLAVCFAIRKCAFFIKGMRTPLVVRTDHKPLVSIINNKNMQQIENPRLLRMKEFLMPIRLEVEYVAGKQNDAADALSRAPLDKPPTTTYISQVQLTHEHLLQASQSTKTQDYLVQMADQDDQYRKLRTVINEEGFPPNRQQLHPTLREFWPVHHDLSVHNDIIYVGQRVLIPKDLRGQVIKALHVGHQGVTATQAKARMDVFWPGIDRDIENTVSACLTCQVMRPRNQKQPLQQHVRPTGPGEQMAADLFELKGHSFLVLVDVYSGWPEVSIMRETTSKAVIRILDDMWTRLGLPEILYTDGGPQFSSFDFANFAASKRFSHVRSAPTYPQSNAHAEAAVKVVKRLLSKCYEDRGFNYASVSAGLRQYRNTPSTRDGLSPAQKMIGRSLRDETTFKGISMTTSAMREAAMDRARQYDSRVKELYDKTAKQLPPVHIHDRVLIWNERTKRHDIKALVLNVQGRRITAQTKSGILQRDRRHVIVVNNTVVQKQPAGHPHRSGQSQLPPKGGHGPLTRTGTKEQPSSNLSNPRDSDQTWSSAIAAYIKPPTTNTSMNTRVQSPFQADPNVLNSPTLQYSDNASATQERLCEPAGTAQEIVDTSTDHEEILMDPEDTIMAMSSEATSSAQVKRVEPEDAIIVSLDDTVNTTQPLHHPPMSLMEPVPYVPMSPPNAEAPVVDPAAHSQITTPPRPMRLETVTAPRKSTSRVQERQHSKRRLKVRRQEMQDSRREESFTISELEEPDPSVRMNITDAFRNAYNVVRRSTRIRKAPERYIDQM